MLTPEVWACAQLPVRHGGLGLRSAARHAAIAHVAAFISAQPNVPHLRRALLVPAAGIIDTPPPSATDAAAAAAAATAPASPTAVRTPLRLSLPSSLNAAVSCPFAAHVPPVLHQLAHLARTGSLDTQRLDKEIADAAKHRGVQHALSAMLEGAHYAAYAASLTDDEARARLMSACAPHSGAWLSGVPGVPDESAWLRAEEFQLACRLRLGLAVAPRDYTCGLCRKPITDDPRGHHALTCSSGGMRKYLHDALVRQLHHVASLALLSPTIECTLALPQDDAPGTRADIVMPAPGGFGQIWVIDFAVTHVRRATAPAHLLAAASSPGGAATLYEEEKQKRYAAPLSALNARTVAAAVGAPVAATDHIGSDAAAAAVASTASQPPPPQPPKYVLVPLVVDTHGAWSPNSRDALARIGRCWGTRTRTRLASAILMHRLSYVHARHVSRILLDSASADPAPSLVCDAAPLGAEGAAAHGPGLGRSAARGGAITTGVQRA